MCWRARAPLWAAKPRSCSRGPFVDVVEPVQHGMRSDDACGRTYLPLRRLQSERPMRPLLVVVLHELRQHGAKMLLVQDDDVVEALSAQRPDNSLRDGVGLWRVDRRGECVDADTPSALPKIAAVDGVPIAEQTAWFLVPGRGLD